MAVGLGVLRLSPAAFWGMTLREFSAAMRGLVPDRAAIGRMQLDELMRRFPDR